MTRLTTLERAFELARSGSYGKVQEIKRALKAEGYPDVDGQIYGLSLRKQLERIAEEARKPLEARNQPHSDAV